MGKLGALIEIIRPVNSLMLGFSILVGAAITGGITILNDPIQLVYAFITGFSMTGASMAINDYYDREIDAINEPQRPIPSGRVSPGEAVAITAGLSVLGLASSYLVSDIAFGIAVFSWVVMMNYSVWGKRTGFLGNLMVSTCIGLPFIYGGVITGSFYASLSFSLLAFLSNTGREVTKGIVDIEGDSEAGINTVAVRQGAKTASIVASAFFLGAVVSSVIPLYFGLVSIWYVPFVALTDLGLIYSSYSLLKEPTRENSRNVKNRILYLMLVGLLGFAAGSLL
ncbi:MAG: UbiA family prenyltransferase [Candidatus Bathyarchaeota archaeon]|nr:UbiA family prenyltransferase [Candidatus Bathyarchaeota archaeon]